MLHKWPEDNRIESVLLLMKKGICGTDAGQGAPEQIVLRAWGWDLL